MAYIWCEIVMYFSPYPKNGSRSSGRKSNGGRRNGGEQSRGGGGGGGRTQAEELAAKAGALVPGKLPAGR